MLRKRTILWVMALVVTPLMFMLTDPDNGYIKNLGVGAEIVNYVVYLVRIFMVVLLLHVVRKMVFDYPEADFAMHLSRAISANQSGLAAIAIAIMMLAFSVVIVGALLT